jgi:uncharacterized repeat protein (TIGR03833 family)
MKHAGKVIVMGDWRMVVFILFCRTRTIVMDGKKRADVKAGARVRIVLKQDQRSGKLTEGIVSNILTNSPTHPHGIKVRLTSGLVGRVKEILET